MNVDFDEKNFLMKMVLMNLYFSEVFTVPFVTDSAMISDLHGVLVDVSSDTFLPVRDYPVNSFNLPSSAFRLWGLARPLFCRLSLSSSAGSFHLPFLS